MCVNAWMYVRMYACKDVCMHVCTSICICICIWQIQQFELVDITINIQILIHIERREIESNASFNQRNISLLPVGGQCSGNDRCGGGKEKGVWPGTWRKKGHSCCIQRRQQLKEAVLWALTSPIPPHHSCCPSPPAFRALFLLHTDPKP